MSDLLQILRDIFTGTVSLVEGSAKRYIVFLLRALKIFLVVAGLCLAFLVIGALLKVATLVAFATLIVGLTTALFLLIASGLTGPVLKLAGTHDAIRTYVRMVGVFLLWDLLLTLYFSTVQISNRPQVVVLIIIIFLIIALFWGLYGIGPDPKKLYSSVVSVLIITTVSLSFPKTWSAAIGLRERIDEMVAGELINPPGLRSITGNQQKVQKLFGFTEVTFQLRTVSRNADELRFVLDVTNEGAGAQGLAAGLHLDRESSYLSDDIGNRYPVASESLAGESRSIPAAAKETVWVTFKSVVPHAKTASLIVQYYPGEPIVINGINLPHK